MARPKKRKNEKYNRSVTLFFTDSQYDLIKDNAQKMELTISEYIRQMTLSGEIKMIHNIVADSEDLSTFVSQIGFISNNLNQIAKYFHTGGMRSIAIETEIRDCISELFQLKDEVLKFGGDYYSSTKTYRY